MSGSPGSIIRQNELEARKRGMRSLDPAEIAHHFGEAALHRELIKKEELRPIGRPSGTKGACSEPEW